MQSRHDRTLVVGGQNGINLLLEVLAFGGQTVPCAEVAAQGIRGAPRGQHGLEDALNVRNRILHAFRCAGLRPRAVQPDQVSNS